MNIDLFTSFAVPSTGSEAHVQKALEDHLENSAIRSLTVVSETAETQLNDAYPILNHESVLLVRSPNRPTFSALVEQINSAFEKRGTDIAVLLNADISFAGAEDVQRIPSTMQALSTDPKALVLSRHDWNGNRYEVTLESEMGLPNLISADVWAFDAPVKVHTELFYSLGQMNCDKFFAYDLRISGYSLFNPCLDIVALHHEIVLKDNSYYRDSGVGEAAKEAQNRHWGEVVTKHKESYFGLVRLRSFDLLAGYLPDPIQWSTSGRLFLCIPHHVNPEHIIETLEDTAATAAANSLHVSVLFESEAIRDFLVDWVSKNRLSNFGVLRVKSLLTVVSKLLSGRSEGLVNALLVNSPSLFTSQGLEHASSYLVVCRERERFQSSSNTNLPVNHSFRIQDHSENLYAYVARLFLSEELVVVFWHKPDKVSRKFIRWMDRTYRRTLRAETL